MSDDIKEEALKEEPLKTEAREFFARVFRGSHHHGPLRDDRKTFKVHASFARGAATYDDDTLTRFVLLCHDLGWRGAIRPGGPGALVFMIAKRARIEERPDEEMSTVHPTLQQLALGISCLETVEFSDAPTTSNGRVVITIAGEEFEVSMPIGTDLRKVLSERFGVKPKSEVKDIALAVLSKGGQ